jgi:3-(3-hydroxy-phenyl)propionate hydroxylase
MPGPEARLHTLQGPGHLTTLFGTGFVALYFSNNPRPPACLQSAGAAPSADTAALRLVRVAARGSPDAETVVDELGQAWQRYDAREDTLYLMRPDGYVMGRWRETSSAPVDIDRVLRRALKDQHE